MANTIGSVDFIVDLDGTAIPGQAKIIGYVAGKIAARAFDDAFSKNLNGLAASMRRQFAQLGQAGGKELGAGVLRGALPNLTKLQRAIGSTFNDTSGPGSFGVAVRDMAVAIRDSTVDIGFMEATVDSSSRTFRQGANDAYNMGNGFEWIQKRAITSGTATVKLRARVGALVTKLREGGVDGDKFAQTLRRIGGGFGNFGRLLSSAGGGLGGFARSLRGANEESGRFSRAWHSLPHGLRQIVVYTALFSALGSQIAVLGSLAGSSIAVLATSMLALGTGALLGVVAFKGLLAEGAKLGPYATEAASGLREIGTAFSALKGGIQEKLFAGVGDSFSRIAEIAPKIASNLNLVANAMGIVIGRIAEALGSAEGIATINALLTGFAPIITALGDGFISLGAALGTIFVAALPATQAFADGFATLMAQFDAFLSSTEGQNALAEFFANGQTIMAAILPLVGAVGQALNDLVTPETIAIFAGALGSLTSFVPVLGQILGVIAELDLVGLFAQALDSIGAILTPLLPSLQSLASVLGGAISGAMSALVGALVPVATALAPIIEQFAQLAADVFPQLIAALTPVITALGPILVLIAELAMAVLPPLLAILIPIIETIASGLTEALTMAAPLFQSLIGPITSVLSALAPIIPLLLGVVVQIVSALAPAFALIVPVIAQVISAIAPLIEMILPILAKLFEALMPILLPLIDMFMQLLEPILELIKPLLELVMTVLPPLLDIIVFLIGVALKPLKAAFDILIPIITAVVKLITGQLKVTIENITTVFKGLGDFISKVFKGDWEGAWKSIGKTFESVFKNIQNAGKDSINTIVDLVNGAIGAINDLLANIKELSGGVINLNIPSIPKLAAGTVTNGAMIAQIGEAGREAVVPLERPLSQVDPAVRALSAYAQGKTDTTTTDDHSRRVVVEAGAIVVSTKADAGLTAKKVLDEFVDNL